jgi:hypothetical protein
VFLGLQAAVDDPVFLLDAAFVASGVLALDLADHPWLQMAVFGVDVIERRHRFDDVRIGVYGSHELLDFVAFAKE